MEFENMTWLFNCAMSNRGIVRLNFDEAACLWRAVRSSKGPILEIGRRFGGSLALIAAAAGKLRKIDSVDLKNEVHPNVAKFLESYMNVDVILGSSWEVHHRRSYGLIYVDGDHTHEGVRKDTEVNFPQLAPGGLILYHDSVKGHPSACAGVVSHMDELRQRDDLEFLEEAGSMTLFRKK